MCIAHVSDGLRHAEDAWLRHDAAVHTYPENMSKSHVPNNSILHLGLWSGFGVLAGFWVPATLASILLAEPDTSPWRTVLVVLGALCVALCAFDAQHRARTRFRVSPGVALYRGLVAGTVAFALWWSAVLFVALA